MILEFLEGTISKLYFELCFQMLLTITRRSPKPVALWVLSVSLSSHPSCHILPLVAFAIHIGPDIHMKLTYIVQSMCHVQASSHQLECLGLVSTLQGG